MKSPKLNNALHGFDYGETIPWQLPRVAERATVYMAIKTPKAEHALLGWDYYYCDGIRISWESPHEICT
jgi:hypothetical protein